MTVSRFIGLTLLRLFDLEASGEVFLKHKPQNFLKRFFIKIIELTLGLLCFQHCAYADGTISQIPCYVGAGYGYSCPAYENDAKAAAQVIIQMYGAGIAIDNVDCEGNWYHTSVSPAEETCQVSIHYTNAGGTWYETHPIGVDTFYWCGANGISIGNSQCACKPGSAANTITIGNVSRQDCFPVSEAPQTTTNQCTIPHGGDPIFPTMGTERFIQNTGFEVGGKDLIFTYDSAQHSPLLNSAPYALGTDLPLKDSALGDVWSISLESKLVLYPSLFNARIVRGDGTFVNFSGDGAGTFNGIGGTPDRLIKLSNGYLYYDQADMTMTDFTTVTRLDGRSYTQSSTSSTSGATRTVQDNFGRSIVFTFSPDGLLVSIKGADGAVLIPQFSASGNLSGIVWPDGKNIVFNYENNSFPWAMTGITDEAGSRYSVIGYDAMGRAVSSSLAGGVDLYQVTYLTSAPLIQVHDVMDSNLGIVFRSRQWMPPESATIKIANEQESTLQSVSVQGIPQASSQTRPAGSGCASSSSTQVFDVNANVTSRDDFNGNRVCYSYDQSRNLRTVQLEGLAGGASGKSCPANLTTYSPSAADLAHPERKTTTTWHPDWALKVREAQPKKITTWVYNGQADPVGGGTASCVSPVTTLPDGKPIAVLCARYEQATTDATGASGFSATATGNARKWSYTYNQYGQMLTETIPKLSSTDTLLRTTTYAYYGSTSLSGGVGHTLGDLYTVTNPLGQKTTYTSYDAAGRLLSSQDANGTTTTRTYWSRGWLKSQSVTPAAGGGAPQTMNYAYWPTGLLQTATLADGSTLNYSYDRAHRLTDVTDGAGNKMHYILDNSGNHTGEQISDASGVLARNVTRVFDALNRVQSVTGLAR